MRRLLGGLVKRRRAGLAPTKRMQLTGRTIQSSVRPRIAVTISGTSVGARASTIACS